MKNSYQFVFLFLAIAIAAGFGCAKEKSEIPAWIEIDSLTFDREATPLTTSSSNFTDAWVYVNSNLVGGFELPARIPVLAEGPTDIIIFPGIKVNGLSALRSPYLKIQRYEENISLVRGQTVSLNHTFILDTAVKHFPVRETFDQANITMQLSPGAFGAFSRRTGPDVFEGSGCGALEHDGPENTIAQAQTGEFILPKGDNGGIFLEMNYKCNTSFAVSLLCTATDGVTSKVGVIGINASDTWKKIYITLSPTSNAFTDGNLFKVAISYTRNLDIPMQQVFIDNIQVLY